MPEDPSTTTPETPPTSGDPSASAPSPATEPPTTFTQEQFNREAGRIRAETKRAAAKELADQLGVSVDEAKQIIEDHRTKTEAEKTEVQRAQEALAAAQREAEEAKAAAAASEFETSLYKKLSAAGVGWGCEDEEADRRMGMARSILAGLGITKQSSDEDIAEKIAVAKGDVPGLFTAKAEGGQTAVSGVTNGRPPAGGQGTQSAMERGRAKARALRPDPDQQTDPFSGPAFRRVGA